MNYTDKIFEMLGVEPDEKFYLKKGGRIIEFYGNKKDRYIQYFLRRDLLLCMLVNERTEVSTNNSIRNILLGSVEIVKIPKKKEPTYRDFVAFCYAWSCGCEWIAKNKDGSVFAYSKRPTKFSSCWVALTSSTENEPKCIKIEMPLEFLSWEDEEPFYMPELPNFKHFNDFLPGMR